MNAEIREEIALLVHSGFYDRDDIALIICEERHEPGQVDPTAVFVAIDETFAKLMSEIPTWPAVTDCDRLDEAFAAITGRGIIALQNAGYTQSDGHDDFIAALDEEPDPDAILGYCFYHGQDLERAVKGEGLCLSFGPANPEDEAAKGPGIGNIIRQELAKAGFETEWNGTLSSRILIPRIIWHRRPDEIRS